MSTTIIAGAGHAGGQTAISLRQAGYDGRIIVCGAEPAPPYQRPPLSKKYLSGELARERVFLRPESFYSRHDVELRLGNAVRGVDPAQRTVVLDDGDSLSFTDLVIATGSRPRRLDVPGSDLGNIFYLRTLEDADAIGNALVAGRRLAVVGGGYIGLEIASTAKGLGLEVCVIEAADRILGRVTAPEMSGYYTRAHRARGVDVKLSTAVAAFEGDGTVRGVDCGTETLPADVVVVGIGVVPRRGSRNRRASPATTGSWWTNDVRPPLPTSTRPETAPATRTRSSAARCGSNRCTMRWSRRGRRRQTSREPPRDTSRPPGSGATSSI